MKEKLVIKNFGPIEAIELELSRFNILIGEQATGKSTVSKILAVCRYFSYIVDEHTNLIHYPRIYGPQQTSFDIGLNYYGLKEYIKSNTFIHYECDLYSLEIIYEIVEVDDWLQTSANGDGEIIQVNAVSFSQKLVPKSDNFIKLLEELKMIGYNKNNMPKIPTSFYLNDVRAIMHNPFYLPTERGLQSVFSLGKAGIGNLARSLFNYFSKVDGILRTFSKEIEIEPLNLTYVNRNGIGYVKAKKDTEFSLVANAASGYQSLIPLILVMKYYEKKGRNKTFLIEEPGRPILF